jgi:AsmA protein
MNNLALQEVSLAFQAKDGQLQTQQTIPQVYQGSYEGNASLTLEGDVSRVSIAEKVVHVNLERLLAAVHSPIQLSGLADVSAQLQGQGTNPATLKASLAGDLQFLIESGAIKGFNLQQLLENMPSLLRGAPIPEQFLSTATVFSQLKGTAKMSNGVLVNHDLVAASPLVAVNGAGSLDLNTTDIAYTLKAQLLNGVTPIKALTDWPLTLKVSGNLAKPVYTVDTIGGVVAATTEQIVEKKTELLHKLDSTLQKKLGMGTSELVKKLF